MNKTDALSTLGTIFTEGKRDAIHVAVEPCIAAEQLYPGQHIGITEGKATTKADKKVGIVDPFLTGFVPEGKMFWLLVYPRTITSLRHAWTHPDFKTDEIEKQHDPIEESKRWISNYASDYGYDYEDFMRRADGAKLGYDHIDYITGGAEMEGESVSNEFWDHYEIIRGEKVPMDNRNSFFTCSC